jgi:hypothetical protein
MCGHPFSKIIGTLTESAQVFSVSLAPPVIDRISRFLRGMNSWRALHFAALLVPLGLAYADAMSWTMACVSVGLASLAWFLEHRSESVSTDLWEGIVVLESVAIVVTLSALAMTYECGFLAAAPFVARRKHLNSVGPRTGYLAGLVVLFGGWSNASGWIPGTMEWVQSAGAAILAYWFWKASLDLIVVEHSSVPAAFAPLSHVVTSASTDVILDDRYLSLRESYRKLQHSFEDLSKKSENHRAIVALARWRFDDEHTLGGLARVLMELSGIGGVSVYNVPDSRDGVALIGAAGTAPGDVRTLKINLLNSPILIREAAERDLRFAVGTNHDLGTVLLLERGRVAGLVVLVDQDGGNLERGRSIVDGVATVIARLLRDEKETRHIHERLAQAELISQFATRKPVGSSRDTARMLTSDVASELGLTGCVVFDLSGSEPTPLGGVGEHVVDVLEFATGKGLFGWAATGAHEVLIDEARDHVNCNSSHAVRQGVGSIFIQPLVSSGSLTGAMVSWTAKGHGISSVILSTLRSLAPQVLRQVFGGFGSAGTGLVDADTFRHASQGPGSFVEIDLGSDPSGTATQQLNDARRRLLAAALGRLPQGGVLTRRDSGTLMAFLPGIDEAGAARWTATLSDYAERTWSMSVQSRGESQQSRQVFTQIAH